MGNPRSVSPRFRWSDWAMVAATALITLVAVAPRLPPGICTGDSGDLQLASATLGIAHPPGYVVYASLGYLLTRVPWLDPAYAVSLGCLCAGLVVVVGCILLQARLGVPTGVACFFALLFTVHKHVWANLQAPEVYLPTLAFEAIAAYLMLRYAQIGRRRDLLISALLWGVALAARPPVVFMLPFVVIAWLCARRRWETTWRQSMRSFLLCVAVGALPGLYALSYIWIRDKPTTPYNYIEQYNRETAALPSSEAGPAAKLRRILWLTSGRQYYEEITRTRPGLRTRTRWLANQLLPDRPATLGAVMCIVALGAMLAYRRSRVGFWLCVGMGVGSVAYLYAYPVHGDAADTLPLLFSMALMAGVACSTVVPANGRRVQGTIATVLFGAMCVFTLVDAPSRSRIGASRDASAFLESLDMASLPNGAAICSTWHWSPALWYGEHVRPKRSDIDIINANIRAWPRLIGDLVSHPIFATEPFDAPAGFKTEPYRNIWRLVPAGR